MSAIYKQPRLSPLHVHKIRIITLPCSMLPCMTFASPSTSRSYGRKVGYIAQASCLQLAYWNNHVIRMGSDAGKDSLVLRREVRLSLRGNAHCLGRAM